MKLGRTVEGEAGVVLLGDVGGVLDPDGLDDVTLDVETEDVRGVGSALVGVLGQLHTAGLASSAGVNLGLDNDRVTDTISDGDSFIHVAGGCAVGHRNAIGRKELFALIFQ